MSAPLPVPPSDTPLPIRGALPVLAAALIAARAAGQPTTGLAAPVPASTAAQPVPATAAIADGVRQAFAAFRARLDAGDYAGAVAHYADDPRFAWVEDGALRYRSRDEVARAFERLRGMGPVGFAYGEPAVAVLARDVALLTVAFETSVGEGAQRHVSGGTMTVTMVRASAGWQFLIGHSSRRRAPAPGR